MRRGTWKTFPYFLKRSKVRGWQGSRTVYEVHLASQQLKALDKFVVDRALLAASTKRCLHHLSLLWVLQERSRRMARGASTTGASATSGPSCHNGRGFTVERLRR